MPLDEAVEPLRYRPRRSDAAALLLKGCLK
jgi:hypothetical protein